MRLHAKISSQFDENGLIEFDCLPGATFIENYNEELDSGSVIIAQQTRRMSGLSPYDWVRVYDEEGKFAKTMLVDDFTETRPNIYEPYMDYTINLMSETKLLEKVQMPNRQWLHDLGEQGKPIRKTIAETCSLYIPKIKVRTADGWEYKPVVDWSDFEAEGTDAWSKFSKPMADISLSQPTLRQALSAMMAQVGCLPTVVDGKLSWMDMRADPKELTIDGATFSQRQTSNASDSFVSELVSQGDSILDSGNSCVSETLRFTDRESAFLKQTENLYLETRYPIYRVSKLMMSAWMETKLNLYLYIGDRTVQYSRTISDCSLANGVTIVNTLYTGGVAQTMTLTGARFVFGVIDSNYRFQAKEIIEAGDATILSGSSHTFKKTPSQPGYDSFAFAAYWKERKKWMVCFSWADLTNTSKIIIRKDNVSAYYVSDEYVLSRPTLDISSLCKENGERSLLDTDFMKMTKASVTSAADLAKFLYGTVGYSVGDKRISGFSSTYSYVPTDSWWVASSGGTRTVTYIENITSRLLGDNPVNATDVQNIYFGGGDESFVGDDDIDTLSSTTLGTKSKNNFANWFFDVEYQPLNSLSVRYGKSKDVPLAIQQLDTPSSALSAMDSLSASEQETVDRLGVPTTSFSQYARNDQWSKLGRFGGAPLKVGDDIVFRIVYSFDANGTAANYFASEGAVVRNYFTSVQTKYRAYQYVGYDQAVVRKENVKAYALLSKKRYPQMTERVSFGALDGKSEDYETESRLCLLSPFMDSEGFDYLKVAMGFQKAGTTVCKNECSVVTYASSVILNQEEFDNASAGLQVLRDSEYNDIGGGIPQKWLIWGSNETRTIGWMSDISSAWTPSVYNPTEEQLEAALDAIAGMPSLSGVTTIPETADESIPASIVSIKGWDVWKDWSELLNASLQIEYYNDDGSVIFGDFFADSLAWKCGNGGEWKKGILKFESDERGEWEYDTGDDHSATSDYIASLGDGYVSAKVDGETMSVAVNGNPAGTPDSCRIVMYRRNHEIIEIRDVAEFVGVGKRTYYLTLTDTKTIKAYVESDGIRYLGYLIPEET